MRTGKDRVYAAAYNVDVQIGNATIAANDFVVGDSDGVIVIPSEILAQVLQKATQITIQEGRIAEMVKNGSSLRDARSELGYHLLQRAGSQ
jgi:regulator of RNase E activity RraA